MHTTIIIHPKYEYLRRFIEQLPDDFLQSGEYIHDGRNKIKKFVTQGLTVNVKRYRIPFFLNRLVYNRFRPTKAERAYEYALKLRGMNVNTPEPIAYIVRSCGGMLEYCYFISVQVAYPRRCYEFKDASLPAVSSVVTALAQYTAHLHHLGVYHKDYSPGNILFDEINGQWEFCLVDINRMEFRKVNMVKGCRNFARLWGSEDMFRLLAQEYGLARHFDQNECVRLVLKYRK
ncbi:MAG: lipopolysaccharide kinase InaA family protein [Odoribacter sp.]